MTLDALQDRYETLRAAPTATDPVVAGHLADAHAALSAAVAAQAGDPDQGSDPDDVAVSAHLQNVQLALDAAQAAQAIDGSTDVQTGENPSDLAPGAAEPDASEEYLGDAVRSRSKKEVVRQVDFAPIEGSDGRTLEGYAAVFDDPAICDDGYGAFRESIQRGAFTKTIRERKPVLMFNHGKHPMIGDMPIGTITVLREDERGLYVKAQLADNWLVQPVRDAIGSQAVHGMSVRMTIIKDDWKPGADRMVDRSIREVALAELGPVVFPAYENTSVSVRSREVVTALADPTVRADVARALLGTGDTPAATTADEPQTHSLEVMRRRAQAVLALNE